MNIPRDPVKTALHMPGAPLVCSGNLINDMDRLLKKPDCAVSGDSNFAEA